MCLFNYHYHIPYYSNTIILIEIINRIIIIDLYNYLCISHLFVILILTAIGDCDNVFVVFI